jgi:hypothetical protein
MFDGTGGSYSQVIGILDYMYMMNYLLLYFIEERGIFLTAALGIAIQYL